MFSRLCLTGYGIGPNTLSDLQLSRAEKARLVCVAHAETRPGALAREEAPAHRIVLRIAF